MSEGQVDKSFHYSFSLLTPSTPPSSFNIHPSIHSFSLFSFIIFQTQSFPFILCLVSASFFLPCSPFFCAMHFFLVLQFESYISSKKVRNWSPSLVSLATIRWTFFFTHIPLHTIKLNLISFVSHTSFLYFFFFFFFFRKLKCVMFYECNVSVWKCRWLKWDYFKMICWWKHREINLIARKKDNALYRKKKSNFALDSFYAIWLKASGEKSFTF